MQGLSSDVCFICVRAVPHFLLHISQDEAQNRAKNGVPTVNRADDDVLVVRRRRCWVRWKALCKGFPAMLVSFAYVPQFLLHISVDEIQNRA